MVVAVNRWSLDVDRGPGWLFIRLQPHENCDEVDIDLASQVWAAVDMHLTYRLVLEMDGVKRLPSALIGQLVLLQKQIHEHGGVLRLCGLSRACRETLHLCRLSDGLPNYEDRVEAVLGHCPNQPR